MPDSGKATKVPRPTVHCRLGERFWLDLHLNLRMLVRLADGGGAAQGERAAGSCLPASSGDWRHLGLGCQGHSKGLPCPIAFELLLQFCRKRGPARVDGPLPRLITASDCLGEIANVGLSCC